VFTASLTVVCLLITGAIVGITSVGAVEPAFHYFRCEPKVGGKYQFECFRAGPPLEAERVYIGSTPESIKTTGSSTFELETTVGTSVLISCSSETGTGTGANPEPFKSTNGEGEATLTFGGCTVSKPSGCKVTGEKFTTSKLHEAVEEGKGLGVGVKFTPASGTTFATISLNAECVIGESIVLKGSDFGVVNEKSKLEFTNGSSALTVGTKEAKLRGTLKQEDGKGILVSVG